MKRALRSELQAIVDALLAASVDTRQIPLDAIGNAIGARAVTAEEIDAIMTALETAGRRVVSPDGGSGEERLKAVVGAARALAPELGRPATVSEIAARARLTPDEVRHALALAKVMQR